MKLTTAIIVSIVLLLVIEYDLIFANEILIFLLDDRYCNGRRETVQKAALPMEM